MKKILIIIPTLATGGMERVLVNLVNSIDKIKYDVTIKTIYDCFDLSKDLNSNINYSSFYKSSKSKYIEYIKIRVYTFLLKKMSPKILYRFLIKDKYDTEIAFFRGAPIKIISGSMNKKSKKLAWVHSDFTRCSGIFDWFNKENKVIKAYEKFNNIICVSQFSKKKFIERMGIMENIIVRYNINLCNEIILKSNEYVEEKFDEDRFMICTVGRLVESKGYDRLLEIHKKLIEKNIIYDLVIVGDGPDKNKLSNYVEKNNLEDTVHFLGNKKNPYKYIKKSNLFVCSSLWEGFSTVVSEAVILGKPVITTRVSGSEELFLNNEYGLIVENTTEHLYEGLKKLITDKYVYNKYKEKVKERMGFFKTDKLVNEIENIL